MLAVVQAITLVAMETIFVFVAWILCGVGSGGLLGADAFVMKSFT
jgi:hypothetical protein